ncbi:MMPL family transporter [Actinotalea sp. M2MS4P-6]|uniref:MMPL family transporter n=1 Tax=Actinotalea sp. M2MS4P-6 TaxID=2983762 RepID=UPI0021E40C3C|nr:MMPL family transporter [Actinotalea sp. M2MS4P-6]MCV2393715.1 MMPL family transporter [Actinotalea sp. M2MS4P-6]
MIAVWVVLAAGLLIGSRVAGSALEDSLSVPGSDSDQAAAIISDVTGEVTASSEGPATSLVTVASDGPITEHAAEVADLADALAAVDGVDSVTNPLDDPATAAASVSPDGQAVRLQVQAEGADVDAVAAAVDQARDEGLDVGVGYPLLRDLEPGLESHLSEVIGITAAILVLAVTLGTALATAAPIASALIGVAAGLGSLQLLGHAVSIPTIVPTLAIMIGLGVGIDYSLFQVARHQNELRAGRSRAEAAAVTAATSGSAVAFAGVTVAVAISALAVTGVDFVTWLGFGTAIVVLIVLLGALTFTPALLAVMGPALVRRRDRHRAHPARARVREEALVGAGSDAGGFDTGSGEAAAAGEETDDAAPADPHAELDASRWSAFAARVAGRPWVSMVAATLVLGVLAIPATTLTLGQSSDLDRPVGTERRTAYDITAEHFGAGANASIQLAVALDPAATGPTDPRLAQVASEAGAVPGVVKVGMPRLAEDGTAAMLSVVPETGPTDDATSAVIGDLRAIDTPDGTETHVGGATATRLDLSDRIAERLPWLIVTTVGIAALLLVMAFRSIVLPIKAAALDLISVAAAYGVVTAVFEWGWGARLFGLDGAISIDSYVPMMLFAVLFGLSMDYEVFLLSSVREHYLETRDTTLAVRRGLASTGRIITAAALIMLAVFGSFVLVDDPVIKVFGVGLAVAVLVDATLVRTVLGPALMVLAGKWNWWIPRWLDRVLPRISL